MFSLGRLEFEGHFKDMGHDPGAAEVSEDFPVYLNDKEQAAPAHSPSSGGSCGAATHCPARLRWPTEQGAAALGCGF